MPPSRKAGALLPTVSMIAPSESLILQGAGGLKNRARMRGSLQGPAGRPWHYRVEGAAAYLGLFLNAKLRAGGDSARLKSVPSTSCPPCMETGLSGVSKVGQGTLD